MLIRFAAVVVACLLVGPALAATSHGDKVANHSAIAAVWNGILEAKRVAGLPPSLDGHDVANLMEGLKIACRYTGNFNEDDYMDGAGYAAVALECGKALKASSS